MLLGLTLRSECGNQEKSNVLLSPILLGISGRLLQQSRHIRTENSHHLFLKLRRQCLDQIGGGTSSCVNIGALNILTDVLLWIVLEAFDVNFAQEQIRYDNLLADVLQRLFILEERSILWTLNNGGDELNGIADEEIVL